MRKIITIVGARPQFIKAAVVSRAISNSNTLTERIIHTGQHYDANMSKIFFDELQIPEPHYNLGIGGGSHAQNTGRMLEKIEGILLKQKPDLVMVYGDTDSTLAGALSAVKLHIPVAHVEAGLRSYNRMMPEEINRILTDHVSTWLFTPTETATSNLSKEGFAKDKIYMVGDVMQDAAIFYKKFARKPEWFLENGGNYILCTIHRAENTDNASKIKNIFEGLASVQQKIILPVHPRTLDRIKKHKLSIPSNVIPVPPVGYLEMIWLENNCELIVTDSGGVQKEAYFQEKKCITLRKETEWVELISGGHNELVGDDPLLICNAINKNKKIDFSDRIYGDGNAAQRIVDIISNEA